MERNKNKAGRRSVEKVDRESSQQGYLENDYGDDFQQQQQPPEPRDEKAANEPRRQKAPAEKNKSARSR
jgi:hypothetical protein